MILVEEILLIIGFLMLPYGLYEIIKSEADRAVKITLVGISIVLFTIETILAVKQ
ncbi:hypothetical protein [Saccharolobus islandicus]|jgi:hypothetical protein|uniref:Uncharacterized protein n=2 Tax=Saccharolobus islandicus TaxID=43080 RepID=C4KI80_SACI6|nr:hypothetical protein [Sulfolobus islandicus]ACP38392.1 conserved hypothetical protein [Sulfolobus islandicus M.14.25]ACR42294.1 conserved hypothetical protein [Sulfolobus islandicus M.16.4]